jgi:hypothetical protein
MEVSVEPNPDIFDLLPGSALILTGAFEEDDGAFVVSYFDEEGIPAIVVYADGDVVASQGGQLVKPKS